MESQIVMHWDVDGNGWAWSYADRSGSVGGDIGRNPQPAREQLQTAARAAVYADRVLQLTMGQVADLRVVAATWPWVEPMPPTVPHLDDVIDPRD